MFKMMWPYPCVLLVGFSSFPATAQYDEQRGYEPAEVRYIAAGFVDRNFTPRSTNSLPDSLAIHYRRIMPMVSFREGAAEISFGYSTYDLAGGSKSTIYFGGRFGTEVPIAGRRPSVLLFPLMLAADFTKAEGIGTSKEDFNIASVGLGVGLKYRYFSGGTDLSVEVEEIAQYSSEGFGVGNGFSAATVGDATILLRGVGLFDGIALGYRFRLQTWAMNQGKFNYRSVSHGPYVGIMF
jgi:hypothetical protein